MEREIGFGITVKEADMAIITKQVNFTLEVLAPPDIFLQVLPLAAHVRQGALAVFAITVEKLNGFVGTLAFALAGLPAGAPYRFITEDEAAGLYRLEIETAALPVTDPLAVPPVPPVALTLTCTATEA